MRRPIQLLLLLAGPLSAGDPPAGPAAGLATILEKEVEADVAYLADAALEGRDTPSAGLSLAAAHIEERLRAAGLSGAGKDGSFRLPFEVQTLAPDALACRLSEEGAQGRSYELGVDFVPVPLADGEASGEVVFLGFGIESHEDKYDDVRGELKGRIALIVESEPRHKRLFEGAETSPAADLNRKLATLRDAGVEGALVVRRPPPGEDAPPPLAFRHTWAHWREEPLSPAPSGALPALEITAALASELAGVDVLATAVKVDGSGKEPKRVETGRTLSFSSRTLKGTDVPVDNVVGLLRGSDEALASEYVVLGAHYDHLGVDARGRIGFGADDNASGTAALIEVAQALAAAGPARSILVCAFAGEEDGLLGSRAFCEKPPVPRDALVAMLNLDMLGRGPTDGCAVLGLQENPSLDGLLDRALKLQPTKVKKVLRRQGQELFERSDHFSFHRIGVPVLFFFEGLPIDDNVDYHMWTDTVDLVDMDKVARTARLVFNCAWLLATDKERPPSPRKGGK
jgi:hypothetical protein